MELLVGAASILACDWRHGAESEILGRHYLGMPHRPLHQTAKGRDEKQEENKPKTEALVGTKATYPNHEEKSTATSPHESILLTWPSCSVRELDAGTGTSAPRIWGKILVPPSAVTGLAAGGFWCHLSAGCSLYVRSIQFLNFN